MKALCGELEKVPRFLWPHELAKLCPGERTEFMRYYDDLLRRREAEEDRRRQELARQEERQRKIRLWNASGVPDRHAAKVMELAKSASGPWAETYRRLRSRLCDGFLVALLGSRGTGKTQMAACLMRDSIAAGGTARYIKAADLFRELRDTFRRDSRQTEAEVVRGLCSHDLLVIDDAHERGHTDFEHLVLTNIIDKRYDYGCSTLLVSNETKEGFAKAVGPSVVSRMHETGEAIVCGWPTFRRSPADLGSGGDGRTVDE